MIPQSTRRAMQRNKLHIKGSEFKSFEPKIQKTGEKTTDLEPHLRPLIWWYFHLFNQVRERTALLDSEAFFGIETFHGSCEQKKQNTNGEPYVLGSRPHLGSTMPYLSSRRSS